MSKHKLTSQIKKQLKEIAKSYPIVYWENTHWVEMTGKEYIDKMGASLSTSIQEKIVHDEIKSVPEIEIFSQTWNMRYRELQKEFKDYGENGVKNYVRELNERIDLYKVKHQQFYMGADFQHWQEEKDEKKRIEKLFRYIDSSLEFKILSICV